MNEEKIVKWFYDHEELLLEIMDKKPYQSDGWDYEIEIVKAFLAQQSNEQVEQRIELIGHADLAINNIYIFSGYGEEVPEGRTPIYAGYKNTHPPVPTAQPKEPEQYPNYNATSDERLMKKPEQEPVAWLVYAKGSRRYFTLTFDVEKVPEIYKGGEAVPLYTTPQQRKPLTDEQIFNVARDHYNPHQRHEISFARAIEAAHGITEE